MSKETKKKKKKVVEVIVQGFNDRNAMVNALANNGHEVWVKHVTDSWGTQDDYYVCFRIKNKLASRKEV